MVCDSGIIKIRINIQCLNPTFSGIWSATFSHLVTKPKQGCLNPTFSGIWSATITIKTSLTMKTSLNPTFSGIWSATILMAIIGVLVNKS